jgi:MFS family permease
VISRDRSAVRRLLASHALAGVAMSMVWPLLLMLVWDRAGDTSHGSLLLGLTGAARMLPYVLISWAAGSLGDRYRRDRVLRASLLGRILMLTVVAAAIAEGWVLVAVLAASAAVVCGTPAYPLLAAALPQVAGESGRRRATDTLVTIEVGAFVVGPALGGILLAPATRHWIPALAVVLAIVGWMLIVGVQIPAPAHPAAETASLRDMFAMVTTTPAVLAALGVVALLNLADGAASLALVPLSREVWGGAADGYGLAAGWLGFGALGAPLLWWIRGSAVRRRRVGLGLLVLALLAVAASPSLAWALVPLALMGAATVQVESAVTQTIQDGVPDVRRAGVLGLADSVMVGAGMVGALTAPGLASVLGPRNVLGLMAMVGVAAIAIRPGRATTGKDEPVPVTARC